MYSCLLLLKPMSVKCKNYIIIYNIYTANTAIREVKGLSVCRKMHKSRM